jgi:predicted nucleic acid-binding protein
MILPDTSAWIDHLRNRNSPLEATLAGGAAVGYSEPVLMEVLMGARDDAEWQRLRRFITGATLIGFDAIADFESAAWINRAGRRVGITAGKVDCLILAVARRSGATLMTLDGQQRELAGVIDVEVTV